MFKVVCRVGTKQECFSLDGVQGEEVERIAAILANNLSADELHTTPEVVSIEDAQQASESHFRYIGKENFVGSANDYGAHLQKLVTQNIVVCPVHTWNAQGHTTELYKFTT